MRAGLFVLVVGMLAFAGCKSSSDAGRAKACEAARDRALPWMEKATTESVASMPEDKRAETEAEGKRELELFRTRFVDVCREMPDVDVSCLDSDEKSHTTPCRDSLRPLWKKVYAGHLGR